MFSSGMLFVSPCRILEFDPETGETVEVCTGISPNGIQITPDEQSLLLSDTSSARIFRCQHHICPNPSQLTCLTMVS